LFLSGYLVSGFGRGPGSEVVLLDNLHFYCHKTWKQEAKSVLLVKTHISTEAQDNIQSLI